MRGPDRVPDVTRVLGAVMARDEWPVLGLAIEHALGSHVDHVVVLDHASTDGTAEGLRALQARLPGRLTVLRLDDPGFRQEAATALMVRLGPPPPFDWVYVFDADEFLLTPPGGLGQTLAAVDPGVDAIRYEVHNWIAPHDFDETDLTQFARLRHRAQPNVFVGIGPETIDAIEAGHVTFFDIPFPSKVIVRSRASAWLAAGSHSVQYPSRITELALPATSVRAGHVPMLSRDRLERKAQHGQALMDAGLPAGHGWQNQVLRRVQSAGGLDEFWRRHSEVEPRADDLGTRPTLIGDDALADALAPAIASAVAGEIPTGDGTGAAGSSVPLGVALAVVDTMQQAARTATERVAALEQVERARREQVQGLQAESIALASQRDELAEVLGAVRRSRSWRLLEPARQTRRRLRAIGRRTR